MSAPPCWSEPAEPLDESTVRDLLGSRMHKMYLSLTSRCNLRCRYCPYTVGPQGFRRHGGTDMDAATVEAAIDFFVARSGHSPRRLLNFFGGEPLLRLDLIRHGVDYARSRYPSLPIVFSVTTNGTLLSAPAAGRESCLETLAGLGVALRISTDGPESCQDATRVRPDGGGSFRHLLEGLRLLEHHPSYRRRFVTLKIAETGSRHRLSNISFLEGLSDALEGVAISVTGISEYGSYRKPAPEPMDEGERMLWLTFFRHPALLGGLTRAYLASVLQGSAHVAPPGARLSQERGRPARRLPAGFCLPGLHSLLVQADGDLRLCFRTESLGSLGSLQDGIDAGRVTHWVRDLAGQVRGRVLGCGSCEWEEACRHCWADLVGPDGRLDPDRFGVQCERRRQSLAREEAAAGTLRELLRTSPQSLPSASTRGRDDGFRAACRGQ